MLKEQEEIVNQTQRIVDIFKHSKAAVRPHFILTGPSGSGKSYIAQTLAENSNVHFLEINAAQLTKEGTSGNSLSKALSSLQNMSGDLVICFVDEFDKLFISGNNNSNLAHETTNGVQNEFLKLLESSSTSVFGDYGKFVSAPVDNVLFIFAGAFNGEENITLDRLREFGIKTEFLGRVGLIYNLKKLSVDSLYQALNNSPVLENYLKLFPTVNKPNVIETVMNIVVKAHDKNTLGLRLINNLLHQYFINDGRITEHSVITTSFQNTLSFTANGEAIL